MSINYAELQQIVQELKEFIVGSSVKKITQYSFSSLVIEFRKQNKDLSLLIYIDSKNTFLGLTSFWQNAPENPYHFTVVARKYLSNLIIKDFYSEKDDRILHIVFDNFQIIAELLGKNGNIFLIDSSNKILSTLHNRVGEKRIEKAGQNYIPLGSKTQKEFKIRESFLEDDNETLIKKITDFYLKKLSIEKINYEIDNIQGEIIKKKEYLENLAFELENTDETKYKESADFILQNLHYPQNIKDNIKLRLDENLSLTENAQNFYEIYKKYIRKKRQLLDYINSIKEKIKLMEEKHKSLIELKNRVENNNIEPIKILKSQESKKKVKENDFKKESNSLYNILFLQNKKKLVYGKSAAGNDELLKKFGKGNYWWFHVRDYQGPFVILLDENLTSEDLKISSALAFHFSKARNAGKASVVYTKCKYVKKIPKIPGKVTYSQEKEIFVHEEPELIKNIMEINSSIF